MLTVNLEALRHVLEGLSSGFRPTPRDILVFALAVIGFVGLLALLHLLQRRRTAQARRRRSREAFDSAARRQGLTEGEKDTLLRMLAVSGATEEELDRLVTQAWFFNRASREYLAEDPAAEAVVAALRFKLDFGRFDGGGPIHSTAELEEPGLRLYVREADHGSGHARLSSAGPGGLVVRMDRGEQAPREGETVQVFFPREDGIYYFATRVRGSRGPVLELDHSERVARVQRRRFARCATSFPARVHALDPSLPAVGTYVIDLGGGGATLFTPHGNLGKRRRLQLEFALPEPPAGGTGGRRLLKLHGRVIRTSRQGSRAHVAFDPMSETDRDRILRFVLSRQTVRQGFR